MDPEAFRLLRDALGHLRDDVARLRLDQIANQRALLASHLETARQVAVLGERVRLLEGAKKRGLLAGVLRAFGYRE